MAHSCTFRNIIKTEDDDGNIHTKSQKCGSPYNLKAIEFKHPDYPELSEFEFLCDSHFEVVFGEMHQDEQKAYRVWQNALYHYKEDFAKARKFAEYFNPKDFKIQNYNKVDDAKINYDNMKRGVCRYEGCLVKLESVRRIYRIIISRLGGIDYKGYYFCSKQHWEKIKLRIHPQIGQPRKQIKSILEYSE